MKKVFFSLAFALLLLSSCGSDENVPETTKKTGELVTQVTFNGIMPKAATSTAIPVTSWSNVNKIQMFLYKADGTVAFSWIINPATSTDKIFRWTNVPEGTYELALVANINSESDEYIATSLDGGSIWKKFDEYNVIGKKINSEVFIDLKKDNAFPTGHPSFGATDVPYAPTSEIFTAYASSVKIEEGKVTNLTSTPLQLKREISLMRIRIDKTNKPESAPQLSDVNFAHAQNFIAIKKMPVGIGLKLGAFAGGIYDTPSDGTRVMIGASGVNTYNTADPTTGYKQPATIIDSNFTLWQDIRVLPNATRAEGKATNVDADAARRYVVILAGWVPAGYEYADGTKASQPQPVYWTGTIKGVFSPNVIREVNMNIKSKGYPVIPPVLPEGELIISVDGPEEWDQHIVDEFVEI